MCRDEKKLYSHIYDSFQPFFKDKDSDSLKKEVFKLYISSSLREKALKDKKQERRHRKKTESAKRGKTIDSQKKDVPPTPKEQTGKPYHDEESEIQTVKALETPSIVGESAHPSDTSLKKRSRRKHKKRQQMAQNPSSKVKGPVGMDMAQNVSTILLEEGRGNEHNIHPEPTAPTETKPSGTSEKDTEKSDTIDTQKENFSTLISPSSNGHTVKASQEEEQEAQTEEDLEESTIDGGKAHSETSTVDYKKTYPKKWQAKNHRKAMFEEVATSPKFDPSSANKSHIETFTSLFARGQDRDAITWSSVKSLMENGLNGKMYGTKGGAGRQFALFLRQEKDKPTKFVTVEDYNTYRKLSKAKKNLGYQVIRKVVHTEQPHSRGGGKEGARFLYPALVTLLASSLEKVGVTPVTLGWE